MKKAACIPTLFSFLLFLITVVSTGPALAQSFDMSGLDQAATQPPQPPPGLADQQPAALDIANDSQPTIVDRNGNLTGTAQFVPGRYDQRSRNGQIINVLGNITGLTGNQNLGLPGAKTALIAPGSIHGFNGFGDGPSIYRGVSGFQFGGILPGCKYAPIDANVIE